MNTKDAFRGAFSFEVKKLVGFLNILDSVDLEELEITYEEIKKIRKASSTLEDLGILEPDDLYNEFFKGVINE